MSQAVLRFRAEKDQFFKHHPQSPLPTEKRSGFAGLSYYDIDDTLDLHITPREFEDKASVTMQTTTGDLRQYLRWGEFDVTADGETATLTLYYSPDHGHFFLPFVDATAGTETYGAGRYLDPHQQADGSFQINFNLAYAPFCAYNENYSCPIPPKENRISTPIRAGEKLYKTD